ncbi:MAG: hypothetical protein ACE5G0_08415 [Rhodothermales bacterium]
MFIKPVRTLVLMAGLLCCLASCDDTFVDPFENDDRYFTLFGFLDQLETEHAVRVVPVTRTPERILSPTDPQAAIDAVVTSIELQTGATQTWRHHLERLDDGTYAHIFRASFIVQPNYTYRLEVRRSDGATATAETTVPYIPDATYYVIDPIQISEDSVVTQDVFIPKVPSPWDIQGVYLMSTADTGEGALNGRFSRPYDRSGERTEDGGWRFTMNLTEDLIQVREVISEFQRQSVYNTSPIGLTSMGVQIRMLDDQWNPPEGVFDPEVLAQPGRLSNVENGYGFWGSIGLYRQEWSVSSDFSRLLGNDF